MFVGSFKFGSSKHKSAGPLLAGSALEVMLDKMIKRVHERGAFNRSTPKA
jgi:hypothetical protein